jgi:hypothetical protein
MVNRYGSKFVLGREPYALIETGDNQYHVNPIQTYFTGNVPENLFVLDFNKPREAADPAYPTIKQLLATGGFLSQFVNFKTCNHDRHDRNVKKSDMILQGVSRQILQKTGVRLWWVDIPKSLPLPCLAIGVDVFHAPVEYDARTKQKGRKASVAAVIVQVLDKGKEAEENVKIYSKTYARNGGEEYNLREPLCETIQEACRHLSVKPKSVVVWRDGIAETACEQANEEITGVRDGIGMLCRVAFLDIDAHF